MARFTCPVLLSFPRNCRKRCVHLACAPLAEAASSRQGSAAAIFTRHAAFCLDPAFPVHLPTRAGHCAGVCLGGLGRRVLAGLLLALALHPAQGAEWVVLASTCPCLLAAVLLISSAQVRRAEALAAERTAQWEAQVLERKKRYIHKSGEIRWVRISVRLLGDPQHPDAKTVAWWRRSSRACACTMPNAHAARPRRPTGPRASSCRA